jgi:hypothetical protein
MSDKPAHAEKRFPLVSLYPKSPDFSPKVLLKIQPLRGLQKNASLGGLGEQECIPGLLVLYFNYLHNLLFFNNPATAPCDKSVAQVERARLYPPTGRELDRAPSSVSRAGRNDCVF